MGNCHTVGPNEALVVSGNEKAFWTMCFNDLEPFLPRRLRCGADREEPGKKKIFTLSYTFMIAKCPSCIFLFVCLF